MQIGYIHHLIGRRLYRELIQMGYAENHYGSPGYLSIMETMLKGAFQQYQVSVSDEAVTFIARNFPLVDVEPEVAGHDDDRAYISDMGRITGLLAHVLPDLTETVVR